MTYPSLGVYEHYKSTPEDPKFYRLKGFARHTETREVLALYIPLYDYEDEPAIAAYVRPLDMFTETVEIDGKTVPRFRYIDDNDKMRYNSKS